MLGGFAQVGLGFLTEIAVSPLPPTDSIILSSLLKVVFFFSYHSTPSAYIYTFLIYYKYCPLPVPSPHLVGQGVLMVLFTIVFHMVPWGIAGAQ